ncbi:hypothetical protein MMC12_005244 [Toensbergia leucococca]|nr:hypothetical protein [Toensbergia leucococca]
MAPVTAAALQSNGVKLTDQESKKIIEYEKILTLHDQVFADTHPRLKVNQQALNKNHSRSIEHSHALPAPRVNGLPKKPPQSNQLTSAHSKDPHVLVPQQNSYLQKFPNPPRTSSSAQGSSGIDPVLLTKSEVLVRAELQQKRQRIERSLEEQVQQKRVVSRQRPTDQEALPDFDVTGVLKMAQEIVKPLKVADNNGANGNPSSSDSFDENTFYSSQMYDSTPEEAAESPKWRPYRPCKFFFEGKCQKGNACNFSHDPALKRKLEEGGSQAMDLDSVNADEQASSQPKDISKDTRTNGHVTRRTPSPSGHVAQIDDKPYSSLQPRRRDPPDTGSHYYTKEPQDVYEESVYSPPAAGESRLRSGKVYEHPVIENHLGRGERRPPVHVHNPFREYAKQPEIPPSPLSNDVRIIRNHITSPLAPQPARVSPLAVAKVPQVAQSHRVVKELHTSRRPAGNVQNAQESPDVPLEPLSSRKRRREVDPNERLRNVAPRREVISPEIHIKEEPISPPPFTEVSSFKRHGQDVQQPLYIDTTSPQYREKVVYQPRTHEQAPTYVTERVPLTPVARRVVSRNGQHIEAYEEPDLRRVVSARQARPPIPMSPVPYSEQYSPRDHQAREVSQVYLPQQGSGLSRQYRASIQPETVSYANHQRSPSPILRRVQQSPIGQVTMAPPPRRIVMDQYGNRFYETLAPAPSDHPALDVPPIRRSEPETRYEQLAPRGASIRDPQYVDVYDNRKYFQRAVSPQSASPRYVEYVSPTRARQVVDRQSKSGYGDDYFGQNDRVRIAQYPETRQVSHYDEVIRPTEGITRRQSVRPVNSQYAVPREQITRVQSVRPEQNRIASMGGMRELVPASSRQVSVRAEDAFARPVNYVRAERPKYRYASEVQERRFMEDDSQDDLIFEAPRGGDRRQLQRM